MSAARFAIFFTAIAYLVYVVDQVQRVAAATPSVRELLEAGAYVALVTLLAASATAHLVGRLGQLEAASRYRRTPRATIDRAMEQHAPSVSVLVPSYKEDPRVVRQTLLSTALQEYPDLDIVLLLDDPPNPSDPESAELLAAGRALPGEIASLLAEPAARFAVDVPADWSDDATGHVEPGQLVELAGRFREAARWLHELARELVADEDHSDAFLRDHVLGRLADDFDATATALLEASGEEGPSLSRRRYAQLQRRLTWTFSARLSSFERKAYASCSHEANKAMNLNSYLDLMGRDLVVEELPGGRVLVDAWGRTPDLSVRDAEFVLTLDADSTLLPEYCLRLVHELQCPDNADVAVIQTPYSSYPGAPSIVERVAGATTDVQHLLHQGSAVHDAAFWVGANALLRMSAIRELRTEVDERGFSIGRYISDRTVIEDTESSVELRRRGWRIANLPERLSYSATPPDFGSLVVQRKRWANGGLVILPALLRLARSEGERRRVGLVELFLRFTYLTSIATSSFALLVLLVYPFQQELLSWFALATALPYFVAVSTDLRRSGRSRFDLFRLYGFNLLLFPVQLAGVASSLVQAVGGQKTDFARTPKVEGRTAAPMLHVLLPVLLLGWASWTLARDVAAGSYVRAVVGGVNTAALLYAILRFVGPIHLVADVLLGLRERMFVPVRHAPSTEPAVPHWASVLYLGHADQDVLADGAPLAVALAAEDREHRLLASLDDDVLLLDDATHDRAPASAAPDLRDETREVLA